MIDVLIADDHQLLIDGIKTTLEDVPDINIVAEANNGLQVLKILQSKKIDVIIMDINMPQMDGLDCTKAVCKKYPDTKVVALSQFDEKRFVKKMIKNGASGYLLKDSGKDEIVTAIRKINSGENYFCEKLSINIINSELNTLNTKSLFPKLTDREIEVLKLICKEFSSPEIAESLFISDKTVENHRAKLIAKAGVKNTAGLVRWAVENDFVD
ncbi:MAG: hypothetical protein B6D61_02655 [Bacteroidetes bacterium 4484_249]|nr:MAG: hypothetical protein B6D61_02655 [Bacteroidetes bacterium 4484_249]